ncbi:hypothetical protein [Planomicrobium okeanokoites]|uniref:hypothetical protein n=1 Tax=Planomicrobium okeanokoites TaxID=244 RepID=UPI0015C441BC|nr:hypothetical protein [Planomicrobium okeanokoites]
MNNGLESLSKSSFPSLADLEKTSASIASESKYSRMAQASMDQIKLFERNKVTGNEEEDFVVSILSTLAPGQVSLAMLGSVSRGIQRVFTSLFNDAFGKGNVKGIIPKNIIDSSQLVMQYNSPGSFNMHLIAQDDYFVNGSLTKEGLEKLKDFLFRIPSEDPSFIIEEFGLRTFAVSKHWFKELKKEEVSLSIIDQQRETRITKDVIHSINKKFDEIKNKTEIENISVSGIIDSANRSVNSLKILKENGDSLAVKTHHEIFEKGLVIATKKYQFELEKNIILNTTSGIKKELYVLTDIAEIP